uniref:Uncharacterized protein n=1 Tax=Romanomermis culicivorax TaxID=13658 RepID=A0A915I5H8_ROMCU
MKCDEESRIPACYRLQKAKIIKNDSRSVGSTDFSDESSLSDGEVYGKSDNFTDFSTDEEFSAEKLPRKRLTNNNNELNIRNSDDCANVIQSSVSETEEEGVNFGEKQSDTAYVQSTNAKLYYVRDKKNLINSLSTNNLKFVQNLFENRVVRFCRNLRLAQPQLPPLPEPQPAMHKCHHHTVKVHRRHQNKKCTFIRRKNSSEHQKASSSPSSQSDSDNDSDSSCSSNASENENTRFKSALEEIRRKEEHPARLHKDIWFNEKGQMNDGPLCRCSWKARRSGIVHSLYPGEKNYWGLLIIFFVEYLDHFLQSVPLCEPDSSNTDRLHHYKLEITPLTNILVQFPNLLVALILNSALAYILDEKRYDYSFRRS